MRLKERFTNTPGKTALKIIKHASERFPRSASGPLLGFDVHEDVLKVTQSYRFPYSSDDESPYRHKENGRYQEELLEQLKVTDGTIQLLGWYQSSVSGKAFSESLVDSMAYGQLRQSANSVVITVDPSKAQYGVLSLRAFRLTKPFLETFIANDYSVEQLNKVELSFDKVFEELPVQLHNNYLTSLLLAANDEDFYHSTQALEASSLKSKALGTNVETLIDSVDDLNHLYNQLNRKKSTNQEVSLREWLPLCEKINFTAKDVEQQVVSDFLTDSVIRQ